VKGGSHKTKLVSRRDLLARMRMRAQFGTTSQCLDEKAGLRAWTGM
jgi:hypothetical protein